jgi:hypothetical protein
VFVLLTSTHDLDCVAADNLHVAASIASSNVGG